MCVTVHLSAYSVAALHYKSGSVLLWNESLYHPLWHCVTLKWLPYITSLAHSSSLIHFELYTAWWMPNRWSLQRHESIQPLKSLNFGAFHRHIWSHKDYALMWDTENDVENLSVICQADLLSVKLRSKYEGEFKICIFVGMIKSKLVIVICVMYISIISLNWT